MRHTPALLAAVEAQSLPSIRVPLQIFSTFNVDFVGFVVRPERAVASADGAEAFEGGFAERWEGDADGFAVASNGSLGFLLLGRHCRYVFGEVFGEVGGRCVLLRDTV